MNAPPLRIAFTAVFWRIYLVTFSIQQFIAFNKSRHHFRGHGLSRQLAGFAEFTPYALVLALVVAGVATVAIDLLVRWPGRLLVGCWYRPRRRAVETPLSFHLEPGEQLLREAPGRRRDQLGWRAGTLVLTDRRLAFYSTQWHNDPVEFRRGTLKSLRTRPARAVLGSLVLGMPGRLEVRDCKGRELVLAVAEPDEVLSWFERPDLLVPGLAQPLRLRPVEPAAAHAGTLLFRAAARTV